MKGLGHCVNIYLILNFGGIIGASAMFEGKTSKESEKEIQELRGSWSYNPTFKKANDILDFIVLDLPSPGRKITYFLHDQLRKYEIRWPIKKK